MRNRRGSAVATAESRPSGPPAPIRVITRDSCDVIVPHTDLHGGGGGAATGAVGEE